MTYSWARVAWAAVRVVAIVAISLVVISVIVAMVFAIVEGPDWLLQRDGTSKPDPVAIAGARTAILFACGGVIAIVTLLLTAWRDKGARDRLQIDREANTRDAFSEAVTQLANPSVIIRIGGLHTLDRVARASADDLRAVVGVLCGFIRENSPTGGKFEIDSQVAFRILADHLKGSRFRKGINRIDLSRVLLEGVDARGMYLRGARFTSSEIRSADFTGSDLRESRFSGGTISWTKFLGVDLRRSILDNTTLTLVTFRAKSTKASHFAPVKISRFRAWRLNRRLNLRGADFEGRYKDAEFFKEVDTGGATFAVG